MSTPIDPNARQEVNKSIIDAGSATIGMLVDTARSSQRKREENRRSRDERRREEEAAQPAAATTPAQDSGSVRAHPYSSADPSLY